MSELGQVFDMLSSALDGGNVGIIALAIATFLLIVVGFRVKGGNKKQIEAKKEQTRQKEQARNQEDNQSIEDQHRSAEEEIEKILKNRDPGQGG